MTFRISPKHSRTVSFSPANCPRGQDVDPIKPLGWHFGLSKEERRRQVAARGFATRVEIGFDRTPPREGNFLFLFLSPTIHLSATTHLACSPPSGTCRALHEMTKKKAKEARPWRRTTPTRRGCCGEERQPSSASALRCSQMRRSRRSCWRGLRGRQRHRSCERRRSSS